MPLQTEGGSVQAQNERDCYQLKHEEMLNELRVLQQCCNALKEENLSLKKRCFPETEEKVKRLKRKNAELAVIAKRLEERAQKLQEANVKMVNTPMHLKGASLEVCKKVFARQRAKDMSEQASVLLAKDKQIEELKQECRDLQAKLSTGKDFPCLLKLSDFDRLLHESQKEVLRLQRQIAVKHLKESLHLVKTDPHSCHSETVCIESSSHSEQSADIHDVKKSPALRDWDKEVELNKKRKECEILEQEVKKKQKRCEELETKLQAVQTENARLLEENSRLCNKFKWAGKVESENADLKLHLVEVTEQRDSAIKESHRLHSKLDNLEQVLKHMRDVSEKRQQLEKDHEDALIALQKRQEEVKRLQQAQIDAKKEHEGAVQLLEANVKTLEEKCRTQTEQFSVLSQELERFRLQTGDIGLLTSTLITSDLPPPQCCSTPEVPQVKQDSRDEFSSWEVISLVDISLDSSFSFLYLSLEDKLPDAFKNHEKTRDSEKERLLPQPPHSKSETKNVEIHNHATSKEKQAMHNSSKSESIQESSKSCPTPEVDTASEMEDIEADSISLNPETENRFPAKLQVFLARYSYNPFDGPNENPEAELPLTAGEYIYIYGDMDEDGFYEGELMDGRRGLVPSNFVERVSDDDLTAFQPAEMNELSQSSGHEIGFISGSSNPRSEEGEDVRSLSPLPCELKGSSEGTPDILAVPYPRKLMLIKQLARSVVVGWEPPQLTASSGNIQSYNIYVDNELRQNVRCGGQTKALIEKLELKTCTYRISVQSMTEHGCSDRMCCTMLIGHGFSLAPTQLRVRCLSATSAEITWQPYNSNCTHALYLNEEACGLAKPGTYWHSFSSLRPCTVYNVKIEAQPKRIPSELPPERREQKTTVIQLTTSSAGPPDAPLDVQVELGPTAGVLLISWLPVTIDAAGSSNGVRVMGYAIYADGQKVLEVTSPTAGSVLIGKSHLQLLHVSKEITVRTMSVSGESIDSVPAQIPSALFNISDCSSLLPPFYNRLISEPSLEKTLNYCPDKFPSKPVSSFSPCNLPTTLTTCTKAKNSTHATCSRGNLDSLPVQSSPNHMLSPPGASTGYFQGSSSSGSSESSSQKENLQENIHATDHATSISQSIRGSDSTRERSEISKIMLEERASKFQKDLTEGDVTMLESAATISNIEHSRSSTLSDIMEEEEDVEEEENFSITSNKKKTLLGLNDQYDGSAKDCWNGDNSVTSIPDLPELLSGRHFGSNQTSGSESEATFYTLPDHQHSVALNEEQSTFKSQTNMARIFVALFEYDPATMSPNPDSYEEELPFKEGQILKVFGDKDPDGFYHGECEGKMGFIPCNMVSELKIHSEDVRAELLQNGWVTSPSELNDLVLPET
ncbi:hypothetical protein GDO86_003060 [Hymenochirus boettgeri]|uniref:SH3 domain-containing protein n=1 Tax=Hymenochirus boettgeri TaxID=247094 RepID=A0A8T2K4U6_9PIPI|nr:hypothetical protein GDO86_003060 [Hymenochirus boettgeri]